MRLTRSPTLSSPSASSSASASSWPGSPMADPIMALLVTVAILASAVGVFRTGLRTFSDHARIPAADIARVAER